MRSLFRSALLALALLPFAPIGTAVADGCYTCGSGSSEQCKNYCRHAGPDTFAARKECEKRGCKISGTASCPTAVNYKVCMAPVQDSGKTVAAVLQCVQPSG